MLPGVRPVKGTRTRYTADLTYFVNALRECLGKGPLPYTDTHDYRRESGHAATTHEARLMRYAEALSNENMGRKRI
jgi:hypothetical protein